MRQLPPASIPDAAPSRFHNAMRFKSETPVRRRSRQTHRDLNVRFGPEVALSIDNDRRRMRRCRIPREANDGVEDETPGAIDG